MVKFSLPFIGIQHEKWIYKHTQAYYMLSGFIENPVDFEIVLSTW